MPDPLVLEPTEAAYWAGLLDGEGHLGIRHQIRKDGGEQYSARMALRLTDEPVVREYAAVFGGSVQIQAPSRDIRAVLPIFVVEHTGKATIAIIGALLPYLRVKRGQADRLLALETSKLRPGLRTRLTAVYVRRQNGRDIPTKSYSYGQELLDQWSILCTEVARLNRPGREPKSEVAPPERAA